MIRLKKTITNEYKYSPEKLNFLVNQEKFYIMDNHLAAAWCWVQKIDTTKKYNLFHIDRHYDLLDYPHTIKTEIIDKGILFNKLSLDEFLNLKQPMTGNQTAQMFRHDNYIVNLSLIYPNLFNDCYFATHKDGNNYPKLISSEPDIYDLDTSIEYWLTRQNQYTWIVNIDLDYFFRNNSEDKYYQFLTDEYIRNICIQIRNSMKNIEVITIAISPTYCGGMDNAQSVLRIFTAHFNIK